MNEDPTSTPAALLSLALSFYRDPLRFQSLLQGRSRLPEGMETILLAATTGPDQAAPAGGDPEEMRQAARFFIEQVLFAPNADCYRLLGLSPDATDARIREHYRLLMRLFHPDRRASPDDWQAAYAGRVNQAYNVLRRAQSRREYDASRTAAPPPTEAPRPPSIRPAKRPPAPAATGWRRHLPRYVLTGAAFTAGLFVLHVYLTQGPRASRAVNPSSPATLTPATAETAATEPQIAGHPPPLPNELTQASPRGAAETASTNPPATPLAEALTGPVARVQPAGTNGAAMLEAADSKSSLPPNLLKKPEVTTIRALDLPALNAKPASHLPPRLSKPEEQIPVLPEGPAAVTGAITSPQASQPPPPSPPAARPPPLARPEPPPISQAESALLLGRFITAYNRGDLGTMMALFGPGHPALNQYRDLFSRTAARQLAVTSFSWRLTPNGAVGRGGLSLQLRNRARIPEQRYTGSLELELGRHAGGRVYIKNVNHVLIKNSTPGTPASPPQSYGGNG